jgi:hypothetical protein
MVNVTTNKSQWACHAEMEWVSRHLWVLPADLLATGEQQEEYSGRTVRVTWVPAVMYILRCHAKGSPAALFPMSCMMYSPESMSDFLISKESTLLDFLST